jgi:hypothetical protein
LRRLAQAWLSRRGSQAHATPPEPDADRDRRNDADDAKRQAVSPEQFDRDLLDVLAHR